MPEKNLNDQIQGLRAYLYEVLLMTMQCEKDIKIFLCKIAHNHYLNGGQFI